MKKFILAALFVVFYNLSQAQSEEPVASATDTSVANRIEALEERLNQQEQEVQTLKKEKETLKKQIKFLRSPFSSNTNNRTVISRKGSKQVIVE